jgi:hypothetical protein
LVAVRMLLLLIVVAIFITGLVWWIAFIGNAVVGTLRKR